MTAIEHGRQGLRNWELSKPTNFFKADRNLRAVLRRYMGEAAYAAAEPNLMRFGELCATVIDEAARIEDRIGNHPRLDRWSPIGERTEQIEFHPNHDAIGRRVWESGLMALQKTPGQAVYQMGLYYLLAHNGEGGHLCSLACTSGMIRALQKVGSAEVQVQFLPPLLDPDYDHMQHAAQFLTEVQGGSDVGANAVTAVFEDGTWRISGEKWFCSNINADQFLMTARPAGAVDGTKGLGLFLVPRRLKDGRLNGFYLRRLKDKLGTRTLASAEVDFQDALAYPVGAIEDGFKNAVSLVLNTSRLMNAVSCAGIMRRAYLEAGSFACSREAFGTLIASFPLVQEAIADLASETCAAAASGFALAALLDKIETGQASEDDKATYRMLVNINKYITSIRATEMVHRAIEVLGGNGAIETFSILPRLYRDMVVLESWEGTHNVLCIQVLRDMQRYRIHEPFIRFIQAQLSGVHDESLRENVQVVEAALDNTVRRLGKLGGEQFAQAHIRRVVDDFAHVAQAALMLAEAQWELDDGHPTDKPDAVTYFVNRHLRPHYDPMTDADYLPRLERFMTAV